MPPSWREQGLLKDLMKKYHIPTAQYQVFDDMDRALGT